MANLTRKGIAKDFETSPYTFDVSYTNEELTFYFSSKINRNKFEERLINNRAKITRILTNQYKINMDMNLLCDLYLYIKIEHRGFLIKKDGEYIRWLSNIKLDGRIVILENLEELLESSTLK